MAYSKTTWVDNAAPPINAQNLNHIEQGIYDAHIYEMLQLDEIPNTTQTPTFVDGRITQILHKRSNATIRTDAFTFGDNTITEVRTLSTGESLTIVTNLTTLETTVTYEAAS